MTNNLASTGLWKMLCFQIFILTTDGTIGCVMSDTWCQVVWHLIVDAGPHTYPVLYDVDTSCEPMHHCPPWCEGHTQLATTVVEGTI